MERGEDVRSYRDLKVWQEAMAVAEGCYRVTAAFPRSEMFGIVAQVRRAAASVPANIAEGWGREGTREYIQFLRVAQGSLKELETHLILSERVGFMPIASLEPLLAQCTCVGKMVRSLMGSLQRKLA